MSYNIGTCVETRKKPTHIQRQSDLHNIRLPMHLIYDDDKRWQRAGGTRADNIILIILCVIYYAPVIIMCIDNNGAEVIFKYKYIGTVYCRK